MKYLVLLIFICSACSHNIRSVFNPPGEYLIYHMNMRASINNGAMHWIEIDKDKDLELIDGEHNKHTLSGYSQLTLLASGDCLYVVILIFDHTEPYKAQNYCSWSLNKDNIFTLSDGRLGTLYKVSVQGSNIILESLYDIDSEGHTLGVVKGESMLMRELPK